MSDTVKVPLWDGKAEARITPCDGTQLVQVCVTYDTASGAGATLTLYASPAECRALGETLVKAGAHVLHRGAPQVADAAVDEPTQPELTFREFTGGRVGGLPGEVPHGR